jgi:hypothetical protein
VDQDACRGCYSSNSRFSPYVSANLLLARKRNPTKEWLKELPYKARKLEEQLYKGAPTLQDYLDKASLKYRLKRVAKNIVTQ